MIAQPNFTFLKKAIKNSLRQTIRETPSDEINRPRLLPVREPIPLPVDLSPRIEKSQFIEIHGS